jgi:DNA (cytosine-5)-methyltransferase 1
MGYHRAGFDIVGVDIDPQPNYPFPFLRLDALDMLRRLLNGEASLYMVHGRPVWLRLSDFDAIHASPPCQGYTALKAVHGNAWPLLIEPVRELLEKTGLPYVIENVQGAPVRRDLTLCGEMFGLRVIRHRFFELGNWIAVKPAHAAHRGRVAGWRHGKFYDGPYFAVYGNGGGKGTVQQWQEALGIDWTSDRRELAEAIPPAYTSFIGAQLLAVIEVAA